jgi:integrase
MSPSPAKVRAKKGSVQLRVSNRRLQLLFSHPIVSDTGEIKSKRFCVSTGYEDSLLGQQQAQVLAAKIQRDIDYGEFDASLSKYKPAAKAATVARPLPPPASAVPDLDLATLWARYEQFKKTQVSQTTYAKDYRKYRNHISELPSRDLEKAIVIRDYFLATLTPNAAKRTLTNISACCDWAVKSKLIEVNPFVGMSKDIQIPKSESEETDINPFSCEERDAIILAFEQSKLYQYYALLVKFLFFTGCRPSEAIALQWKYVGDHFLTFRQAVTVGEKGLALKEGLKTQAQRRFPINGQLREILEAMRSKQSKPDDFLFLSKQGGFIDFGDFLNHAWKGYVNRHGKEIDGLVTQLVKQGVVSEYRKPYQCRHTFITLCVDAGIDAKDIARWVGNSPEMIYRHYAGKKRDLQVPEL